MFLSVEKELLANNYYAIKNYGDITIYQNGDDAKMQVGITFNTEMNNWTFSFPLKNSLFNYVTYFKEPRKIKQYALGRICDL